MDEHITLSLIIYSFLISTALIIFLKPLAMKAGLTDKPSTRKLHNGDIPLIGGIAIFLSLSAGLILYDLLNPFNLAFLLACSMLVLVGIIDDHKNIHTVPRFFAQIVASLIMIELGNIEIKSLGNLFGFGEIQLGQFAKPFTVFALVGGINAFNMIDGMDGLAGSLSLFIFLVVSILCNTPAFFNITLLCIMFIASIMGFLIFNLRVFGREASVFLGDAGSTLFGFSICSFLIAASQGEYHVIEPSTVLWIIALPLMDTVCIMIRRVRKKRSPFAPDREHFHHILPLAGFSVNGTLVVVLLLSILLALVGILGEYTFHIAGYVMFYLFLCTFAVYFWGMCHAWKLMKITRRYAVFNGLTDQTPAKQRSILLK